MNQTPTLRPGGLRPKFLDSISNLDAEKCTHEAPSSKLHANILLVHLTIDHSGRDAALGEALNITGQNWTKFSNLVYVKCRYKKLAIGDMKSGFRS